MFCVSPTILDSCFVSLYNLVFGYELGFHCENYLSLQGTIDTTSMLVTSFWSIFVLTPIVCCTKCLKFLKLGSEYCCFDSFSNVIGTSSYC
jgi:hypothetical protein